MLRKIIVLGSLVAVATGLLIFSSPNSGAEASSCKVDVDPALAGTWSKKTIDGYTYTNVSYSKTLYTGGSWSGCHDINVSRVWQIDNTYAGPVTPIRMAVQYYKDGAWHDDPDGVGYVPYLQSYLSVIADYYPNSAPFRILVVRLGITGVPAYSWPSFKVYS